MLKNKKKKGTLDFYPIIIKESGVTSFIFFSSIQFRKIIENSIELYTNSRCQIHLTHYARRTQSEVHPVHHKPFQLSFQRVPSR